MKRLSSKTMRCSVLLSAILAIAGCHSMTVFDEPVSLRTDWIAAQGYVYGFPLMLMEETRAASATTPYPCAMGGPMNQFVQKFKTPDPDFRAVVKPNVDTLYSSAFLDLSEQPMVLSVPEIKDRFYLMAMLDAWSNNFAGPGSQTNGGEAMTYLITGPNWTGQAPAGMTEIAAPTDLVWIIGRTEIINPDDLSEVNAIQSSYTLSPLNPDNAKQYPAYEPDQCQSTEGLDTPEERVKKLDGVSFFTQLDQLLKQYPPAEDDAMLKKLGLIGVGPHAEYTVASLSDSNKAALNDGIGHGQSVLSTAFDMMSSLSSWSPDPTEIELGDYDQRYLVRAIVAQVGFGANRNQFATYMNASQDADLDTLDGAKASYTMTFDQNELPPVNAFWSVTVYDEAGFLVKNSIQRYALGSRSNLEKNSEGGITITMANQPPKDSPTSNWLPVPEGKFQVTLRMYWPKAAILDGQWQPPEITVKDEE